MSVPVSVRWNKWRMWRQKDGSWLAQQPFQIKDPMFKHRSSSGEEWPVFSYKNRDSSRVLHEMQLAMAKAAAHQDGPRVEFTAVNGHEIKPGAEVKVKRGSFSGDTGVVHHIRKNAHLRSRYSDEQGEPPIMVDLIVTGASSRPMPMYFGPDDLEVIK